MLKKHLGILLMLTVLVGFTSCQDDDEIYDRVVGRVWVGDLGFGASNDEALESGVSLGSDGFGTDKLVYFRDGVPARELRLSWRISNTTIYLDYGNQAPPREIRNIYVSRGQITGDVWFNGQLLKSGATFRAQ